MTAVAFHVQAATAEPLLLRLDGVQKSGQGWRARCPACGGSSRKVSITEANNSVLIYCFGGCAAIDVLQAVDLNWGDVLPPRSWPESPEERRQLRRAAREETLIAALPELAYAAAVMHIAAKQLHRAGQFADDDMGTLIKAEAVIGSAREFFCDQRRRA